METGAPIAATLCVLATLIPLGLLFTALVLRAAVSIFNRFASDPKAPPLVPRPSIAKGMLISLLASLANATVYSATLFAAGAPSMHSPPSLEKFLMAWLISFPISLFVLATLLTTLLPTTFPRALLITLCYVALAVLLVVGLTFVVAILVALIISIASP
jgi:hypothetical protein